MIPASRPHMAKYVGSFRSRRLVVGMSGGADGGMERVVGLSYMAME